MTTTHVRRLAARSKKWSPELRVQFFPSPEVPGRFDYYDGNHYRNAETVDPQGPVNGTSRVIRGPPLAMPARRRGRR